MSLEKQKEFLFRDKKCSAERQKLPCLDINKLLDWSQIDSGLGCDGKRVLPKPRRFAAIFEKVLKPGKKTFVICCYKIDENNFTLDYFIHQTVFSGNTHASQIYFRYQLARCNCTTCAYERTKTADKTLHTSLSSASLLLRERRGVEKIKKDNLPQGPQVPYGRALMSA